MWRASKQVAEQSAQDSREVTGPDGQVERTSDHGSAEASQSPVPPSTSESDSTSEGGTEKIGMSVGDVRTDRSSTPTTPPPPPLDVQPRLELDRQPGAFHVAPGRFLQSRQPFEGDSESEGETDGRSRVIPGRDNSFDDAYLVEADLVQEPTYERTAELEGTMLVEALPLRRCNLIVIATVCVLLVVSIALGVSLGVVIPTNRSRVNSPSQSSAQPSMTPSIAPSFQPSVAPSRAPSASPSTLPSSMPTSTVLNTFRESLPSHTIEQLTNESTPQMKAWKWIATVDRPRSNLRRLAQRYALTTLYFSTSGEKKWKRETSWLNSTQNECTWYGCTCTENGTVVGLDLSYNRLSGTVPKELSLLIYLDSLQLDGNKGLRGTIESEFGALKALRVFGLYDTTISGALPTELGLLTLLTGLYLGNSRLSGTIPTEIGLLENLEELYLSNNPTIVGPLPTSLGSLSKLTTLVLSNNKLTSSIPVQIGNLTILNTISIENNSLTGTLPPALWRSSLNIVQLFGNRLQGTLPTSIGRAIRVSVLKLNGNELVGTVPTELGLLASLTRLWLQSNHLTGTIPTELGRLTNLNYQGLSLSTNKLTGTVPTELGNLLNVQFMEFFDNQLHGSVPSQLCMLVSNSMKLELDCDLVACTCGCTCRYSNESTPAPSP